MKRTIIKVLAAGLALFMISVAPASAAPMDNLNVKLNLRLEASGTAFTHLSPGQVAVDVSYVDRQANSRSTYAKVTFIKTEYFCARAGCRWTWQEVSRRETPKINHTKGWRSAHFAIAATAPISKYRATYQICVTDWGRDPCSTSRAVKF